MDDFTPSQLQAELKKRNASTKTSTPRAQLVQRLLRIEAGNPLEDDMAQLKDTSAGVGSRSVDDEEEEFGMVADDEAALANTIEIKGSKGGEGENDQDDDFGIESGDEAELEALAVEVESPNLKRTRQPLEINGSDAKRQCVGTGELVVLSLFKHTSLGHSPQDTPRFVTQYSPYVTKLT